MQILNIINIAAAIDLAAIQNIRINKQTMNLSPALIFLKFELYAIISIDLIPAGPCE